MEQQPLGTIQEKGIGTIKKMFIDDIESIELLLAHALPEGIANAAVPVFVFIAMFLADWKLALLSLCSLPLGIISMMAMYKSGTSKINDYYAAARKMNNTIVEYINGMEVVKVFNRDGESYHRFEKLVLILCMSFGIGAPLLRSLSFMSTLPQVNFKIESLEQMICEPPLLQSNHPFTGINHTISFENVHFSYQKDEVLHGISLTIPEGSLTALVGESGSGKSTLARLLVHFYDVSDGSIRIGGQDLRNMSLDALNHEISYVAQEQFLFNISLMENIRLGRLNATDEEVLEAAKKAQCSDFLSRLENGIYTLAGDGGKQLNA